MWVSPEVNERYNERYTCSKITFIRNALNPGMVWKLLIQIASEGASAKIKPSATHELPIWRKFSFDLQIKHHRHYVKATVWTYCLGFAGVLWWGDGKTQLCTLMTLITVVLSMHDGASLTGPDKRGLCHMNALRNTEPLLWNSSVKLFCGTLLCATRSIASWDEDARDEDRRGAEARAKPTKRGLLRTHQKLLNPVQRHRGWSGRLRGDQGH